MAKYLGEVPVVGNDHPYAGYSGGEWAMLWVEMYSQIDGAHHKQWVLDQVARILKGTPVIVTLASWDDGTKEYKVCLGEPSADYLAWVDKMRGETNDDGEREYGYDEGIAP